MTYPIASDTIRRIQNEEGLSLDVRPWPDGPDWVALMAEGDKNEQWFGKVNIAMKPEFAKLLGEALIKCADELSENHQINQ